MQWPRRVLNFPVILIAVCYQYIQAIGLWWDVAAGNATPTHALALLFHSKVLPLLLFSVATMAWTGFFAKHKITTLLFLMPQQLLLYMCAGASFEAIVASQFADGVIRPQAFLMVDQCLPILLALFYSWVVILIIRHASNGI